MKPVDQDKFFVAGVSRGNCQQAAVASIFGLDLAHVPNFAEQKNYWDAYEQFLESRGFIDIEMPANHAPDCFYLAYGPSARGVSHAVVCRNGRLVHDPHPSRAGLLEVTEIHLIVPKEIS